MMVLGSWLCVIGQTTQPTPLTRKEPTEDDFDKPPFSPNAYHLYYLVADATATVYSMEPVCGEIIAVDASSGETLCEVTTDLGGAYTLYIGAPRIVDLYVIVDGITYYGEIISN